MFSKAFLSCSNLPSAESSVLPPLTMSSPFFCPRPKGVGRVREKVYPISGLNNVYIIYFLWMSTLFFFFLTLPLIRQFQHSEAWANHSFTVHINPSTAGHAIFSFHISVSSKFLEPSHRKDIFVPGALQQVKPGCSEFLVLS